MCGVSRGDGGNARWPFAATGRGPSRTTDECGSGGLGPHDCRRRRGRVPSPLAGQAEGVRRRQLAGARVRGDQRPRARHAGGPSRHRGPHARAPARRAAVPVRHRQRRPLRGDRVRKSRRSRRRHHASIRRREVRGECVGDRGQAAGVRWPARSYRRELVPGRGNAVPGADEPSGGCRDLSDRARGGRGEGRSDGVRARGRVRRVHAVLSRFVRRPVAARAGEPRCVHGAAFCFRAVAGAGTARRHPRRAGHGHRGARLGPAPRRPAGVARRAGQPGGPDGARVRPPPRLEAGIVEPGADVLRDQPGRLRATRRGHREAPGHHRVLRRPYAPQPGPAVRRHR